MFTSSTWRELSFIEFALQSFASVLEASHVKWFTHNQPAAKIIEVGSMKLDLHMIRLPTVAQKRCVLKLPIIPRVLHYRKSQFHVCELVVPFWPSAHYSPLVIHKKSKYLIAHNMHLGKEAVTRGRNALLIYRAMAQSRIYIVLR